MADQPTPTPVTGNPTLSTTSNPNTGAANPPNGPQDEGMNWTNLFFLFIALAIFIASICLFIYMIWVSLFLHLQDPQFGINKVTITNLSISSYSQISGDWEVEFIFRNPNTKVNLYYDQTEVDVSYISDSIAQTIIPPFMQNTKNETTIRATFTSVMMYVHDGDSIKDERSHGSISFNLRMMVRVQARVRWAGTWVLTVDCSKLKIAVSSGRNGGSGTLVGGSKKCTAFNAIGNEIDGI
ncbi:NDR1/HIN1-like protein 26 [Lactuca sativa]|uniref:NDR1/HIN1-like protein 26 n=1 Tax=Lactuca sativa TaxID=4236 RepID=UPI000CBC7E53|nr:NDR1/HIN1-like protein 26 [Lactuca sativa]